MKRISAILKLALPALVLFSCPSCQGSRGPVTIVFTGDTQGRLVPAG